MGRNVHEFKKYTPALQHIYNEFHKNPLTQFVEIAMK